MHFAVCSRARTARHTALLAASLIVGFWFAGVTSAHAEESTSTGPEVGVPLSPVAFIEMPRLRAPQLSPDGTQVLVIRSKADWQLNKRVDQYQLIYTDTGAVSTVPPWKKKGHSLSTGIWSPDNRGFITPFERKGDKKDAAYFYDIKSGQLEQIFSHPEDVRDLSWNKEGSGLFFRARREDKRDAASKKLSIKPYDVATPYELWKHNIPTGVTERVLGGDYSVRAYTLSEDNSVILHSRLPEGAEFQSKDRELWLHNLVTDTDRRLTENDFRESDARLSPDNSRFAYIATVNEKGEGYYEDNLFVQKVGEAKPRLLLPDVPMEIVDFNWARDGESIFVLGNIGVRTELFQLDLATQQLERLSHGDHTIGSWQYNRETDQHSALVATAKNPGEVYLKKNQKIPFEKLSAEYDSWNGRVAVPEQKAFQWAGRDGTKLEGILVYPIDHKTGAASPLVTITHGGPRSSSQFGSWNTSRYVSVLAAQGYAVFLPNHRGGTGYGDAFMRDMVGNYFNNSHLDVLDGIEALVEQGIADPDRLVKMGWSAGGHMTNKLITFTDKFKAASSGAGASDWISMYGESDVRHNRTPWFGGSPWQENAPLDSFSAQSPLKDAWRVKTPTLFFNGERDVRVPPTQEIMMYRAVRAAGAPTKLFIAPGEPHGYRKPIHQLFKINTELEWYARYALDKNYVPSLPELKLDEDAETDEEENP